MSEPSREERAAAKAIREFSWWNYGLDGVDPNSEYAEWVEDLSAAVVAAVRKAQDAG